MVPTALVYHDRVAQLGSTYSVQARLYDPIVCIDWANGPNVCIDCAVPKLGASIGHSAPRHASIGHRAPRHASIGFATLWYGSIGHTAPRSCTDWVTTQQACDRCGSTVAIFLHSADSDTRRLHDLPSTERRAGRVQRHRTHTYNMLCLHTLCCVCTMHVCVACACYLSIDTRCVATELRA